MSKEEFDFSKVLTPEEESAAVRRALIWNKYELRDVYSAGEIAEAYSPISKPIIRRGKFGKAVLAVIRKIRGLYV